MTTESRPKVTGTIRYGVMALTRAPFRMLVLLACLVAAASASFDQTPTDVELALSVALLVIAVYVQIAIILAAGATDPSTSADRWITGAFRRRCFWRFVGTSLLVVLALFAGAALAGIGIFVAAALVGLSQSACVLERLLPLEGIKRSARVSKGARGVIGSIFAVLVLLPSVGTQVMLAFGWAEDLGPAWFALVVAGEILTAAGTIALTKAFVDLGGSPTPPVDALGPPRPDRRVSR